MTASGDCISARGRVTDGTSHIGVKDVLVRIGSQDTLTDDTGEYILKNILSGPQTIVASKSCYNTQQTPVTIELGFPKTVNVVMAYAGGDADTCITHKPYDHEFICPGGTGYDSMCLYEPEAVDMKLHFVRANVPWCFDSRHFKLRDCRTGQVIWETCDVNWTDHWTGWLGTNCVCIILRCSSTGHSYHVDRYAFHH